MKMTVAAPTDGGSAGQTEASSMLPQDGGSDGASDAVHNLASGAARQGEMDAASHATSDAAPDAASDAAEVQLPDGPIVSPDKCLNEVDDAGSISPFAGCVLIKDLVYPSSIAIDATYLYWTTRGTVDSLSNRRKDGTVVAMPLAGGAVKTLANRLSNPESLVLHGGYAYWEYPGSGGPTTTDGVVMRVALGGGAPEVLADNQPWIRDLAVDDTYAYYIVMPVGSAMELRRAPVDRSSPPVTLIPKLQTTGIDLGQGTMVTYGGRLYWRETGVIDSVAVDGSGDTQTTTNTLDENGAIANGNDLMLDQGVLYWIWGGRTACGAASFAITDGTSSNLAQENSQCLTSGLALDDRYVYWGYAFGNNSGQIWSIERSDRHSGVGTTLLSDQSLALPMIAVSATDIFVVVSGDDPAQNGFVVRIPK